eukprot:TRINITY_DN686_c0_g1_i3.p1 TRINITY_DN686_c0_g1~~TRINITY_DN686_c0_g1_i3.p1  ORF type:complete len:306 (-),score=35.24 TRINITY_DN686_c0_g1_i3:31-948(-)
MSRGLLLRSVALLGLLFAIHGAPTPQKLYNATADLPFLLNASKAPRDLPSKGDSYNASRALLFAHFSNAAYCSASALDSWSCAPCKAADPTFTAKSFEAPNYGTQAFVGSNDGDIVVSFRGSSNLVNWIENLYVRHVDRYPKCDGCLVHSGFYTAWSSLKDGIVAEVQSLLKAQPKARVFLTGHSLGASLAVLAAAELHFSHGIAIEAVYTYGEPRVGNAAFRDFYNQGTHLSWRLTHDHDPVPHLPLQSMGFSHISTEVFYNADFSKHTVCDSSGEDPTCSDKNLVDLSVADHLTYLDIKISDC